MRHHIQHPSRHYELVSHATNHTIVGKTAVEVMEDVSSPHQPGAEAGLTCVIPLEVGVGLQDNMANASFVVKSAEGTLNQGVIKLTRLEGGG